MANFIEVSTWEPGIYQLSTSDLVQGGAGGTSNTQPQQLANRTKKIYDILAANGIFITPTEEVFVGQPGFIQAIFEGTVANGNLVYYNIGNVQFEKAIADSTAAEEVVGIADVTNGKVITLGLVQTVRADTPGQILFLSDSVAGAMTTVDTGVPIAQYIRDGVISMVPASARAAQLASIPNGSLGPEKFTESYYTQTQINAKCPNWDTAYTERLQWDGGNTNLNAATARTSLGLNGTVTSHDHNTTYYTQTQINAKCPNWDTAYSERRTWDGGITGLVPSTARTSLGLTGDVSTHNHDSMYYTQTQINAKCSNWDSAYSERRQWDGSATNLNAATARTSLGLTGDVSTHNHDSMYYTKAGADARYGRLSSANSWGAQNTFTLLTVSNRLVIPLAAPSTMVNGAIWIE